MKRRVAEQTVLFISVLKWVALATIAGAIVGASTAVFCNACNGAAPQPASMPFIFVFASCLVLSVLIVQYLAPDARGHGTEKSLKPFTKFRQNQDDRRSCQARGDRDDHCRGGSVGKEGPCAQIGAGLSSIFADLLKFDNQDRKKLVICGISAGFAAVFGTPIAGAIFGVEVCLWAAFCTMCSCLPSSPGDGLSSGACLGD